MTTEEIQELTEELQRLNIRQAEIIQRLTRAHRRERGSVEKKVDTRSEDSSDNNKRRQQWGGVAIGDKVHFKPTNTTRGGTGTVIRFTRTRAVVRKPDGSEIQRAPHNLRVISEP